ALFHGWLRPYDAGRCAASVNPPADLRKRLAHGHFPVVRCVVLRRIRHPSSHRLADSGPSLGRFFIVVLDPNISMPKFKLRHGWPGMVALLVAACAPQPASLPSETRASVPSVPVAVARRGDIQQTLGYSGEIRAREQISVMPRAAGRVERLLVDVGSRVA